MSRDPTSLPFTPAATTPQPVDDGDQFTTLQTCMEEYLCSAEFDKQWRDAYSVARHGGGSNDRHISRDVLMKTIVHIQAHLPSPLDTCFRTAPDQTFVASSLESIAPQLRKEGLDLEEFEMALQVVFLQLAATTDKLEGMMQDSGL